MRSSNSSATDCSRSSPSLKAWRIRARLAVRALAAAREAEVNIDAIDTFTNTHGVRFGLALHIGEVLYGNIGSGNRLDFTCIGPP